MPKNMIIITKCFKDSIYADKRGKRYRAKTTFVVKSNPFTEKYYLTNGMQVNKNTCMTEIKK